LHYIHSIHTLSSSSKLISKSASPNARHFSPGIPPRLIPSSPQTNSKIYIPSLHYISPPPLHLPSLPYISPLSILPSPHPTKRCSPSIKPNTLPQIPPKPAYIRINLPRALQSRARNRTCKPALGTQARELEITRDNAVVKDEPGRYGPWRDGGGVGLGETEGAGGFDV